MIFDDHLVGGRPINVTELALIFLAKKVCLTCCLMHETYRQILFAKKNFMQTGYVGWMFLLLFVIVFVAKIQETKKNESKINGKNGNSSSRFSIGNYHSSFFTNIQNRNKQETLEK